MNKINTLLLAAVLPAVAGFLPVTSYAGISLDTTRLVVPQAGGGALFQVFNSQEDTAYLVNVRLSRSMDGKDKVSEVLASPPLFRLEPKGKNAVRVRVLNPSALPTDRESLFYTTVRGTPGSPVPLRKAQVSEGMTSGGVSTGVGFIIKTMYRPSALGAPDMNTYKKLALSRVPGGVQMTNPTPYYLALGSLSIDGHPVSLSRNVTDLLVPFGKQFYGTSSTLKKQAAFSVYDDFGGLQDVRVTVQ